MEHPDDGFDWKLSKKHPLVLEFKILWEDGEVQRFRRLEMQKLYFEDGKPKALFLAALPVGTRDSFGIAIALRPQESPPAAKSREESGTRRPPAGGLRRPMK